MTYTLITDFPGSGRGITAPVSVNLLPADFQRRMAVSRALRFWVPIWLIAVASVTWLYFDRNAALDELKNEAARMEEAAAPVMQVRVETADLREEITAIRRRETWLTRGSGSDVLQLIGIISRSAGSDVTPVAVSDLAMTPLLRIPRQPLSAESGNRRSAAGADSQPEPERRTQLVIHGAAADDLAVAAFISGLRDSGVFESVELKSTGRDEQIATGLRNFEIVAVY